MSLVATVIILEMIQTEIRWLVLYVTPSHVWCICCRHSIEAFQPPSRAAGKDSNGEAAKTPADSSLPNIVRPSYNDLRSADAAVDAADDDAVGSASETTLPQVSCIT